MAVLITVDLARVVEWRRTRRWRAHARREGSRYRRAAGLFKIACGRSLPDGCHRTSTAARGCSRQEWTGRVPAVLGCEPERLARCSLSTPKSNEMPASDPAPSGNRRRSARVGAGRRPNLVHALARSGLCHVFVVAPDGSGLTPVGPLAARRGANEQSCPDDEHASFSPDSKRSRYPVHRDGQAGRLQRGLDRALGDRLLNRDGSGRHVIYQGAPFSGDLGFPVFSPNGKQLVFERTARDSPWDRGQSAVFMIGVDGSAPRRLTPWEEKRWR